MAGAVPTDYTEILKTLPLPEKYLMSKTSRGSQGSSESDEWVLEVEDGHGGQTEHRHVETSDQSSDVPSSSEDGVRTRDSWGSADAALNLLGQQAVRSSGGAPGRVEGLSGRWSEERSMESTCTSLRHSSSLGLLSDYKVRSLGGTPVMDRKTKVGNSLRKPRSTESILNKVKELLGDQTARAKVTGIVEAQKAVLQTTEPKHVAMVTPGLKSLSVDTSKHNIKAKDTKVGSHLVHSSSVKSSLDTVSSDSGISSTRGSSPCAKSRRAVKNTSDISLFTPRFTVLRDGRLMDRQSGGIGAECQSDKGVAFGRNTDSVPTAHVSPSPLVQAQPTPTSRHGNLSKFPSEENIRSGHKDIDKATRRSSDISAIESQLSTTEVTEAWNSHPNVAVGSVREEFHALDPNMTTDATYLPDSRDMYKKGISLDLASRQGYGKAGNTVGDRSDLTAASSRHESIPSSYNSYAQDSYHRAQDFPHSTSVPSLSAVTDRSYYPSGRTVATPRSVPGYNPAAYSATEFSTPYPGGSHGNPSPQLPSDHFTSDLTSWQQKHQEALRRQQIEASQPIQHLNTLPFHHQTQTSATNILLGDPHKLDAIKRAADNIIKEKDMIIERQKGRIMDLERHTKDSELQRQKDLLQKALDDSDNLTVKLQEYQYQNATLKARLTEYATTKKSAQDEIEKKLNASEYEIQQLKQKMSRESTSRTEEIGRLADELKATETQLSKTRSALSEERSKKEALRKQLDSMERYLDDLPTADEHTRRTDEIRALKEEVSRNKQSLGDMEKKLGDAQKGLKSRDGLIETLEKNETSVKESFEKLKGENQRLRQRLEQQGLPTDDIEELVYQKRQLQADLDKAKKLLESKHKRQQQMEARHRMELSQVEERLSQEESAVTALREEVIAKEQNLIKLRKSIKELGSENQDLLQKTMSQRDTIQELEKQLTGDVHRLENRLMKEIGICFSELQSLVQICVQHAEGKDPNISALLGVKASSAEEPEPDVDAKDVASLKFKVTKVREMRNEIDKLRELISNKYAEDMGENLNCTTQ